MEGVAINATVSKSKGHDVEVDAVLEREVEEKEGRGKLWGEGGGARGQEQGILGRLWWCKRGGNRGGGGGGIGKGKVVKEGRVTGRLWSWGKGRGKANEESTGDGAAQVVRQRLLEFGWCSGLEPNLSKSCILVVGMRHVEKEELLHSLGILEGQFLIKYLGIPLSRVRL
ncbi:hypothetical protein Ancab_032006 [Ancistrocladus abbreviatus]